MRGNCPLGVLVEIERHARKMTTATVRTAAVRRIVLSAWTMAVLREDWMDYHYIRRRTEKVAAEKPLLIARRVVQARCK
jgi:hypothetical protein